MSTCGASRRGHCRDSGTRDLLLSDTVRAHRKLRHAGVPADLHVYEGFAHADYMLLDATPESGEHYAELGAFISRHLGAAATPAPPGGRCGKGSFPQA